MKFTVLPQSKLAWLRFTLITIVTPILYMVYSLNVNLVAVSSLIRYSPQQGDIIFQSLSHNDLTDAIEGITDSPYSHCGIVLQNNGKWYVREAISTVHDTPLTMWVLRGRKTNHAVYRLKSEYHSLIPKFLEETKKYLGRGYDIHYSFTNRHIYCSELVFNAWNDLNATLPTQDLQLMGKVMELGEMNWKPHEKTIRNIEYGKLPLDRRMITPKHLAEADQLTLVTSTY